MESGDTFFAIFIFPFIIFVNFSLEFVCKVSGPDELILDHFLHNNPIPVHESERARHFEEMAIEEPVDALLVLYAVMILDGHLCFDGHF